MSTTERLAGAMLADHPAAAARIMERSVPGAAAELLAGLPIKRVGALLYWMAPAFAAECAAALNVDTAAAALGELDAGAAAAILRRTGEPRRDELVAALPRAERNAIAALLASAPGTAGAIMDPGAVGLPDDLTVADALAEIRRAPPRFARYVYVIARGDRRLAGVLNIWELVAAAPEVQLATIMHPHVERIPASAPAEAVIDHPGWSDWYALPVVDAAGTLIGAIGHEVAYRLRHQRLAPQPQTGGELAMQLAELFWLGLAGVTRGLAEEGSRRIAPTVAAAPEPSPEEPH